MRSDSGIGTGEIDLGFARVDLGRERRCGRPEVIFGEGKTPEEVAAIAAALHGAGQPVLATRVTQAHFDAVREGLPGAVFHARARAVTVGSRELRSEGTVGVVSAGTSDLPVAEEALVTLEFLGWRGALVADVGVAGLHRLLARIEEIRSFSVLVVVAGMEGALPSVVTGLVDSPVIAVPTSTGYGVGAGGFAALAGMLSSCASGLVTVNIDNGFGAACAADAILRLAAASR